MPKNKSYGDLRDLGRVHPFKHVKIPKAKKPRFSQNFTADMKTLREGLGASVKRDIGLAGRSLKNLLKRFK